jgi:hypothetical protein
MALWLESSSASEEPEWRWRVTRVDTGERRYFRSLAGVLEYISDESGMPSPR